MTSHPAAFKLEAYHVGEGSPEERQALEAHLQGCEPCGRYLAELDTHRQAFLADEDPEAFLRRPAIAAAMNAARVAQPERRPWWHLGWLLAPAAVAAIVLLAMPPSPTEPSDIRLKGADIAAEVVLLRAGAQRQIRGELVLAPKDAFRLQVTLTGDTVLSAGILEDDGTWTLLADAQALNAGVHFLPDDALHVGDEPVRGWLLVGTPEQVAGARKSQDYRGLRSMRVSWSDSVE